MKSVCVYCGSNEGRLPVYAEAARSLGSALVERGLGLVYGGASVGIMGVLADTVLSLGGRVTGVMPESIVRKEVAHRGLTELHVTSSMHERKMMMADRDASSHCRAGWDAGGGGVEWPENVAGYYDGLTPSSTTRWRRDS